MNNEKIVRLFGADLRINETLSEFRKAFGPCHFVDMEGMKREFAETYVNAVLRNAVSFYMQVNNGGYCEDDLSAGDNAGSFCTEIFHLVEFSRVSPCEGVYVRFLADEFSTEETELRGILWLRQLVEKIDRNAEKWGYSEVDTYAHFRKQHETLSEVETLISFFADSFVICRDYSDTANYIKVCNLESLLKRVVRD